MNDLVWMLPLSVFVIAFAVRLVLAPFIAFKADSKAHAAAAQTPKPIDALVEVLRSKWESAHDEHGPLITFYLHIVNREDTPLILRASFQVATDQGSYTPYLVSLDGRPHDEAIEVRPGTPVTVAAVVSHFMYPVPEHFKNRVKYPSPTDTNPRYELILTDLRSGRSLVVTDKKPYDSTATAAWTVLVKVTWVGGPTVVGLYIVNRNKTDRIDLTFQEGIELVDGTAEAWRHAVFEKYHMPEHLSLGPGEGRAGELEFRAPFLPAVGPTAPPGSIKSGSLIINDHVSGRAFSLPLAHESVGEHVWS